MDSSTASGAITSEMQRLLVEAAIKVRPVAYAPYSSYQVGAAVLTESGAVFTGVNVENASFGGTICAERVAMCSAVAAGERELKAIAVATRDGGHPCGICRQFLAEFGWHALVLVVHAETGEIVTRTLLSELLPAAFLGRR
jgi:cytidine deaminase